MTTNSHRATCSHCQTEFEYHQYHSGFGDQGYMYCDLDEAVLTWSSFDPVYEKLVPGKHPWTLGDDAKQLVEAALNSCPYGGHFSFSNPPLCPHCKKDISTVVPGDIYFVVTGRRVEGEKGAPIWKDSPPAGHLAPAASQPSP